MLLIKQPLHTAKSFKLHERRQYTFLVHKKANKVQIKKKVDDLYNVVVTDVNTALYTGKKVHRYTKKNVIKGQRPSYKKAIVTLQKGDLIDINRTSA